MEFTLTGERDDVAASFEVAERFAARKASNPAMTQMRLFASREKDVKRVEASNSAMTVRNYLWAEPDVDEIDVLVPPKLRKVVSAMAAGQVVLSFTDNKVVVTGEGRGRYELPLMLGQWNVLPAGEDEVDWDSVAAIDSKELIEALAMAKRYAGKNESQPSMMAVHVRADGEETVLTATDAYRMARINVPVDSGGFFQEGILLPIPMVDEIAKLFPDGEVKLADGPNLFFVAAPNAELFFSSRKIGTPTPGYDGLIPKDPKHHIKIPRSEAIDSLSRVSAVAEGRAPVKLSIKDGEMVFKMESETGSGEDGVFLPEGTDGDGFSAGYNLQHFIDGLKSFRGDEVTMSVVNQQRPAVMRCDGESMVYVMSAVRVQGS